MFYLSIQNMTSGAVQVYTIAGSTTSYSTSFSQISTLQWWVTSANGFANATSSQNSLTIGSSCVPSPASSPVLVSPSSGAMSPLPSVTLQWSLASLGNPCGASGASGFNVSVGNANPPVTSVSTLISPSQLTLNSLAAGNYYWMITYTSTTGNVTSSPVGSFSVCSPSGMNVPAISSPVNGSTQSSTFTIAWADATPSNYCQVNTVSPIVYSISGTCAGCLSSNPLVLTSFTFPTNSLNYSVSSPYSLQSGLWTITVLATSTFYSLSSSASLNLYVCIPLAPVVGAPLTPENLAYNLAPPVNFTFSAANFSLDDGCQNALVSSGYNVYAASSLPAISPSTLRCSGFSDCLLNLPSATIWYWSAVAYKTISLPTGPVTLSSPYQTWQFEVCNNKAPKQPQLIFPANGSIVDLTLANGTVVLNWLPIAYSDFGIVCAYENITFYPFFNVYLGANVSTLGPLNSPTFLDSSTENIIKILQPGQNYVWRVASSNTFSTTSSPLYMFSVIQSSVPSPTPNGTQTPQDVIAGFPSWEIGVIVGVLGFLVILFLVFTFLVHRKIQQSRDNPFKVDKNMPELRRPNFIPIIYPTYQTPGKIDSSSPDWQPFVDVKALFSLPFLATSPLIPHL